jgi:hypothetical protein
VDFTRLSGEQFEMLCARLLSSSGYTVRRQEARARDIGVDFSVEDQTGEVWLVEVKHFRRLRTSTAALRQGADQLRRSRELLSANGGILLVSMMLPAKLKTELEQREDIAIWDGRDIRRFLESNPEVEAEFQALLDAQPTIERMIAGEERLGDRATELIQRIEELPPGRETWRDYEELCVEILNYTLIPPFRVPVIQSRSEDGLDVRDAVYPIGNGNSFWDEIKRTCSTRFAVSEFKNYSESISQKEVEALQQYLFSKAMRNFGLLCSRGEPSDSAFRARRRAWMESDKLIVFLSDEDLKDLIRARSFGEDTTEIIDTQLDEFFLTLSP